MNRNDNRSSRRRALVLVLVILVFMIAVTAGTAAYMFRRISDLGDHEYTDHGGYEILFGDDESGNGLLEEELIGSGEDSDAEESEAGESTADGAGAGARPVDGPLPDMPAGAAEAWEALSGSALSACTDADGRAVRQDASGRHQYAIDLVLHAPTEEEQEEGCSMQQLRQVMSFRNEADMEWERICLRDYAQMHLESSRSDDYGWDSHYENMTDLRTGSALSPYRDSEDASVVWVDLDTPLRPGEEMQISFEYTFPVLSDVESGCRATFGYSDNSGWFLNDGKEPVLALGNFYPILAAWLGEDGWDTAPDIEEGGECFFSPTADYRLTAAVPAGWLLAATGEERQAGEALTQGYAVWQSSEDEVRDIAVVAGEGLARKEKKLDREGVTVAAIYYKQHEAMSDLFLESGAAAVEAFTAAFGEFPYKTLDVTECALFAGGMEYPELVLISDQMFWYYDDFEKDSVRPLSSELAIVNAHEVGHNWFYGAVGNDEYREAWLDESFASYSEHVYRKYISDSGLGDPYDWADGERETWDQCRSHDIFIDLPADQMESYQTPVYPYGCYFLLRLRRCMGDEQFTQMMHEYYDTYKLRTATTEGFLNTLLPYIRGNAEARQLCRLFLEAYSRP